MPWSLLSASFSGGPRKGYCDAKVDPSNPTKVPIDIVLADRKVPFFFARAKDTTLLVGVLPVVKASRPDLNGVLKSGTAGATGGGSLRLWRDVLVVAEVAFGLILIFALSSVGRARFTCVG